MYRKVVTICTKTLPNSTFCPHRVFMCFVWISEQRSFCYTTLNYRFLKPRRSVFTAQYGVSLYIMKLNFGLERICMSPGSLCVSLFVGNIQGSKSNLFSSLIPLKPSGHYMYRQFNIQQLYFMFLCGSQNKQRLFPYAVLTD